MGGGKSSFDDVIHAVYDLFDQWDPGTTTMIEVCDP